MTNERHPDEPLDGTHGTDEEHLDAWLDEPEFAAVATVLGRDELWAEPSADLEDRLIELIGAEAAAGDGGAVAADSVIRLEGDGTLDGHGATTGTEPGGIDPHKAARAVIDLETRRRKREHRRSRALLPVAAAACLIVGVLAGSLFADRGDGVEGIEVALAGADAAPEAFATAVVDERGNGVRIVLTVDSLEPAPPGMFYAAWVVRPEPRSRVGAGTFHLRGGGGTIELWAGVSATEYSTISVTLQSEDDPAGPGEVVLRGTYAPAD